MAAMWDHVLPVIVLFALLCEVMANTLESSNMLAVQFSALVVVDPAPYRLRLLYV